MADTLKGPAEDRLVELRKRLAQARDANVLAVASEGRAAEPVRHQSNAADEVGPPPDSDGDDDGAEDLKRGSQRKSVKKRRRAEREADDVESKTLARRVNRARWSATSGASNGISASPMRAGDGGSAAELVSYGGAGTLKPGAADRVAEELRDVDERNAQVRAKKPVDFDEDKDDIGFINEHNRRFNSVVDRMYGKHENVKEIKDNLERGTALN